MRSVKQSILLSLAIIYHLIFTAMFDINRHVNEMPKNAYKRRRKTKQNLNLKIINSLQKFLS